MGYFVGKYLINVKGHHIYGLTWQAALDSLYSQGSSKRSHVLYHLHSLILSLSEVGSCYVALAGLILCRLNLNVQCVSGLSLLNAAITGMQHHNNTEFD